MPTPSAPVWLEPTLLAALVAGLLGLIGVVVQSRRMRQLGIRADEREARRDAVTEWKGLYEAAAARLEAAEVHLAEQRRTIRWQGDHIDLLQAQVRGCGREPAPPPDEPI